MLTLAILAIILCVALMGYSIAWALSDAPGSDFKNIADKAIWEKQPKEP